MRNTRPAVPEFSERRKRAGTRPLALHKPNLEGTKHGVPKSFRRYSKRYGKGTTALVATHLKFPVEML